MLFRQRPTLAVTLPAALAASAAIAALLERAALARHRIAGGARALPAIGYRVSAHVADVNAAGSYFAMIAVPRRSAWRCASAATGARSGCAPGRRERGRPLAVRVAQRAWRGAASVADRRRAVGRDQPVRARARAAALAVAVLVAARRRAVRARLLESDPDYRGVGFREQFIATSLRMIAARPLFGVGEGQYYRSSPLFLSPQLAWTYGVENAHNYLSADRRRARPGRPRRCSSSGSERALARTGAGAGAARRAMRGCSACSGGVAGLSRHLPDRASAPDRRGGVSVLDAVRPDDGAGGLDAAERRRSIAERSLARRARHGPGAGGCGCGGGDRHPDRESDDHGRATPSRRPASQAVDGFYRVGNAGGRYAVSLDGPLREPVRAGRRHTRGDSGSPADRWRGPCRRWASK